MRRDVRWFFQLIISIFVSVGNGSIFCFGIISPMLLKAPVNLSPADVNVISTVGVVTSYFSLPTGLFYDRFGPMPTLAAGSVITCVGWSLMAMAFAGVLPRTVTSFSICFGIAQWAASFYETGSVITNLEAFSHHQGRVIIIQKTFMGLGSAVIAQMYSAFFTKVSMTSFCVFLAIVNTLFGVFGALFVRKPTRETRLDGLNSGAIPSPRFNRAFNAGCIILAIFVCFVIGSDVAGAVQGDTLDPAESLRQETAFAVVLIVLLLSFFVMIPLLPPSDEDSQLSLQTIDDDVHDGQQGVTGAAVLEGGGGVDDGGTDEKVVGFLATDDSTKVSDDPTQERRRRLQQLRPCDDGLLQTLKYPEIYLLWFISFMVWGAGTVVSSNSNLLYAALTDNFSDVKNAIFVSIFAAASAIGRMVVGFALPFLLQRGWGPWRLVPIPPLLVLIGLGLFFVCRDGALAAPFFMIGLATGVTWGSTVLVIKALFARAGAHYNVLYTAGALTPLVLDIWLFTWNFDHAAKAQGKTEAKDCRGTSCFAVVLGFLEVGNALAFFAALAFAFFVERRRLVRRVATVVVSD